MWYDNMAGFNVQLSWGVPLRTDKKQNNKWMIFMTKNDINLISFSVVVTFLYFMILGEIPVTQTKMSSDDNG